MSGSNRSYSRLRHLLGVARAAVVRRVVVQGVARWSSLLLAVVAVSFVVLAIRPGGWGPIVALAAMATAALAGAVRYLVWPLLRVPSLAAYTRAIDAYLSEHVDEEGEFLNALELGGAPVRIGTSEALVDALVQERVRAATGLDLLAPGVITAADERITIPTAGRTESLNAAVAGAIIMYEMATSRTRS